MAENKFHTTPASIPEKLGFESIRSFIGRQIATPGGRICLDSMRPSADLNRVEKLRLETGEMMKIRQNGQSLPVSRLEEIEDWLAQCRAAGTTLKPEAFPPIREHARQARILYHFLESTKEETPNLFQLAENLIPLKELESSISRIISDQGTVRDDASPELVSIRSQLNRQKESLRNTVQKIYKRIAGEGMASDEGPTLRSGRMVIPVLAEYKRKVEGFIHDVSSSGQTVYLEPSETLQINNDIRQLESAEKREIELLLKKLTSQVREQRGPLSRNSEIVGALDLIHARTLAAEQWDGVIPRMSKERSLRIRDGKNPVLILKTLQGDVGPGHTVVPLDLEIIPDERGIVISGPNAGGKSVALKTAGLFVCMHQSGIPIPADANSTLPLFSGIFLDMGDEQSIEQDLSTFSSRLKWMKEALDRLDRNGIVLIDEAGTGTDPEEGGALYQSFMEMVIKRNAMLIATTHHGALKVFAHDHPQLANGAMEFDQKTLTPAYRFRKGTPGSSYAFEIANRMDVPGRLIERARTLIGEQRDRMADLLLSLEEQLQEALESRERYRELSRKAEEEKKNFKEKSDELARNRDQKLDEAWREADRIMQQANRKIEKAVERITNSGRENRDEIRKAREELSGHKRKIRDQMQKRPVKRSPDRSSEVPEIGDHVRIEDGDTVGELLEKNGKQAVVLAGGLKIKTDFQKLVKSKPASPSSKTDRWKASATVSRHLPEQIATTLHLRGLRGDEAVKKLTHYIDHAVARSLHEVDIIHGKGDGILKKLVHEHLAARDEVESFDLAPLERGGAGCTVVILK
ncbi:MAG: endonuclease MutS2 [Balneolaceae bacterium]